jgi:shikimate kinase
MNVILIGFRGSGKTTVGKKLAERLFYDFVDLDDEIEMREEKNIRRIFEEYGEEYFRRIESLVVADIAKTNGKVIGTGGGVVLKYKNIQNLKRSGVIIFLDVDAENSIERLMKDETTEIRRPKLTYSDWQSEIRDQVKIRRPFYLNAADYIVNTSARSVDEIVEQILQILKSRFFDEFEF